MENLPTPDFDKISSTVNCKTSEIMDLLQQCQIQGNIPSVNAFEEQYSIKYKTPSQSPEQSVIAPTHTELSEAFKALEKIPPCFPKVQRKHAIQTASSKPNLSKRSESLSVSNTSLAKVIANDVALSTEHLYKGCKDRREKFQDTFKTASSSGQNIKHQFQESVDDLRRALGDLEKLIPRGLDDSKEIFGAEETKSMALFREEIDALLCIQENKDIYPAIEMPDDSDLDFISKIAGDLLRL